MIIMFSAGAAMVALGAVIAGFLVYKTKYAGKSLIAEKEPDIRAEAFNIDDGFMEDLMEPPDPEKADLPEPIKEANQKFIKQFSANRLIREGEKSEAA